MNAPVVYKLADKPSLEVGGVDKNSNFIFDNTQGFLRGVRLSDGTLVVIDVARVHFFDANGLRFKIVGRIGSGPGEFRYLTAICRAKGDTVVVADSRTNRVTIIDAKGVIVRELIDDGLGTMPSDGCLDDGFIREKLYGPRSSRPTAVVTRFRLDGTVVSTYPPIVAPAFDKITPNRVSLASSGQRVYFGTGESSEVRVTGPGPRIQEAIRSDDPTVARSALDVSQRSWSKTLPAYGQFHTDPEGRLWVRDYLPNGDPHGWTAFDDSGRMLGRLLLPARESGDVSLEVIGFGPEEILVRRRAPNGAVYLAVFPVVRIGPKDQ